MIILMHDYTGSNTIECFFLRFKIFIQVSQGNRRWAHYVFTHFRYAQAAFVISPFISLHTHYMCIDKYTFDRLFIRIFFLILLIKSFYDLVRIYYE
ncbi:hypothetical protein D9M68_575550 [compost metagenome]